MEKQKMNKRSLVLGIVCGLLISLVFYIIIPKSNEIQDSYNSKEFEISYLDLNKTEINYIEDAIWDLNQIYKYLAKEIIITSQNTTNKNIKNWINTNGENWRGVNINKGEKIYLVYTGNPCELRKNLCHELLHTIVEVNKFSLDNGIIVNEEFFVDSIDDRFVCYGNPNCSFNNSIVSLYQQKTEFGLP